jgi:L-rhamnose isomerase
MLFNPAEPVRFAVRNFMKPRDKQVRLAFALAKERYAGLGVNVDQALKRLAAIPISLHCWQGDDVGGFENFGSALTGGIVATGPPRFLWRVRRQTR